MADNGFLPVTKEDMTDRGWYYVDFLLVTGDAYVDHPSFGTALVGRLLESLGYRVGVISQPDWRRTEDFLQLGKPRYACLITAGNLDSMVNHYTANKKRRRADDYSPGGKTGRRPDRASIVYASRIREAMPGVPVIIGGVEASLRRFAHYDYWDNSVRRSILADAQADLLVYGMAERQVEAIAGRLAGKKGVPLDIPGTAYLTKDISGIQDYIMLPSFDEVAEEKRKYAEAFKIQYTEQNHFTGKTLVQPHGSLYLVQNPPAKPLEAAELDRLYELPYRRTYHPDYEKYGGVPAIKEVEFSITGQRGCFGGCAFCALHFHQGTVVQGRSPESIIAEAERLAGLPGFKGYIHDVGGPTANFRRAACRKQREQGQCLNRHCLYPEPCPNLDIDHSEVLQLLRRVRRIPGVKKVFLRSGLRYDYLLAEKDPRVLKELCEHHVSGQLKVAPEHVSKKVTTLMRKPHREAFDRFRKLYTDI
ncbi:MAG: YgiQ family radical SAM protein, partial [Bacillota bacterium]